MNAEPLRQKLLAAARAAEPSARVPHAFEKRVMARLRRPAPDLWSTWGVLLWRSLTPCCAVMVIVGLSALAVRQPDENLGEQLHAVLVAGLDASEFTP